MLSVYKLQGVGVERISMMKHATMTLLLSGLLVTAAGAQFTGPSVAGNTSTVAQAASARLGTYVTVTGHIIDHQRQDYFTFRDGTGEIRVEIGSEVWRNRPVAPETKVQLLAEVDQSATGRYLWVKSLDIID